MGLSGAPAKSVCRNGLEICVGQPTVGGTIVGARSFDGRSRAYGSVPNAAGALDRPHRLAILVLPTRP